MKLGDCLNVIQGLEDVELEGELPPYLCHGLDGKFSEVLEAVFDRLISLNGLSRAPELYDVYKENVTTDLTFDVLSSLLPVAAHLAETREIGNYSIGREQVYDWINYSGAMVLVPMREQVMEVMRQVISEP